MYCRHSSVQHTLRGQGDRVQRPGSTRQDPYVPNFFSLNVNEDVIVVSSNDENGAAELTRQPRETRLYMTPSTKIFLWGTGVLIGAALGFAIPWLGRFAADHPIPYKGVVEFLVSFESPIMVIGRPVTLAVVGFLIALFLTYHSPDLRITDDTITIIEGDDTRVISRAQVGGVFRKNGKVTIESPEGRTLFSDDVEGKRAEIAEAFRSHGYPWEGR